MGYRFEEDGKSFVFLTDNELSYRHPGGMAFEDYCAFAQGADLLIHDAEYRPRGLPSDQDLGPFRLHGRPAPRPRAGVARFGLFHHNQDRTDRDVDEMVEECRKIAAGRPLDCFAVHQDMEIVL